VIAVISVFVVVFATSTFFTSATVTISPKQRAEQINTTATLSSAGDDGAIEFQTVELEHTEQTTVTATQTTAKKQHATGEIQVYNEYTDDPIQLVERTRYRADSTGNVYRAPEATTVPGKRETEPGTVTVRVRATEPGNTYNIEAGAVFHLPGLEGDPSYEDVYAKATGAVRGGATGNQKVIDPDTKQAATNKLRNTLKKAVQSQLKREVPDSYVMYPSLTATSFSDVTQASSTDDTAVLAMTATASGYMLPRAALTRHLVRNNLPDKYDPKQVTVTNLDELSFRPAGSVEPDMDTVRGTLTGNAQFVWSVDTAQIKREISGVGKHQIGSVLSAYTSVDQASAEVRPFWLSAFPSSPDSILVNVSSPAVSEARSTSTTTTK